MQSSHPNILEKKYKKLVLQISFHEVSFCLYNTLDHKIETFGSYILTKTNSFKDTETEIINLIKQSTVLQSGFDNVIVLHNNTLNCFVPQALFDEKSLISYLQYNVKVYENDYVAYDEISNNEMNTVYIPFVGINNSLLDIYQTFIFKHSHTVLVKKIIELAKNSIEPQLYVHIEEHHFQLIAVKNQKMILFNTFDFTSDQDFIYHLLFAIEQLKFNPETIQVKLLGNIHQESELFSIAYKYIRNVALFTDHYNSDQMITQENYLKHFILIHACE
ncbi:DUF3822 family protein [Flavobacterium sp.]|uniref:DUF3822 family protein n=1 Tax=Flavobacterium sp. TaxID=239 RepID=UPI003D0E7463